MKNYRKSDYAVNKNRKGIVYQNADGSLLEITFEKIAEGDPKFTQDDFEKMKAFSDQIYLDQVRQDNKESYHCPTSLDVNKDTEWLATPSLEDEYFSERDELPDMKKVKKAAKRILPPIQKRRFLMYLNGLSTVKIADIEGCNQKTAWESIDSAKTKIKKYFGIF